MPQSVHVGTQNAGSADEAPADTADLARNVHPETKHPAHVSHWKKGGPSPNPGGKTTPERKAMRAVSETFRDLHSPAEIADVLWSIGSGVDPFARERKRNPDGVPTVGAQPIDWGHRVAALKLYAEYALGKPLQGVVVDAQVQQQIAISGRVETGPIDVRAMPPEVRAALRLAASAALGRALPVLDASSHERPQRATDDALRSERAASVGLAVADEPVRLNLVRDSGPELDANPGDFVHELIMGQDAPDVKHERKEIVLDFRGSTNLVDATLDARGILIVRFRAAGGGVARAYRYANVTAEMMTAWREAPSAGAWFAREIRARHQQYPLVKDPVREPGAVL